MRGIYFGKFDEIGRKTNFDAAFVRELRKELALLSLIGPVCIPPDHLIENPLALPTLESLKQLVQSGRIGTSASAAGQSPLDILERKIDERLEVIPRGSERREELLLRRGAQELRKRFSDMVPASSPFVRDIANQILLYSKTLAAGLLEAAEYHQFAEARLLWEQAARAFDFEQGIRTYWLISLDRLKGTIPAAAWRRLLMMIQSCYFRFGELANDCIWYPDSFWGQLRRLSLPSTLLPTTVQSNFSYDNIIKTARLLGANLEPALKLSDTNLAELIDASEMQRFTDKLKQALLSPRSEGALLQPLEPRELVDVRIWLEKYDPPLNEYQAAAEYAVGHQGQYLLKIWAVLASVIMHEEIGSDTPDAPACTYNPRTRVLKRRSQAVRLSRTLGHLFIILVIHSSVGIPRWYIAQEKLETEVAQAARLNERKLDQLKKETLLLSNRTWEEQEAYLRRISKRQERLQQLIRPLGLSIQKNRFGLWTIAGARVNVEEQGEVPELTAPKPIPGPPRLRRAFEILATYYPYPVPSDELVSALELRGKLPKKIDAQRKAWRDTSALNHHLEKISHPCRVRTPTRGDYQLVCQV